jgi:hypothetical protein
MCRWLTACGKLPFLDKADNFFQSYRPPEPTPSRSSADISTQSGRRWQKWQKFPIKEPQFSQLSDFFSSSFQVLHTISPPPELLLLLDQIFLHNNFFFFFLKMSVQCSRSPCFECSKDLDKPTSAASRRRGGESGPAGRLCPGPIGDGRGACAACARAGCACGEVCFTLPIVLSSRLIFIDSSASAPFVARVPSRVLAVGC